MNVKKILEIITYQLTEEQLKNSLLSIIREADGYGPKVFTEKEFTQIIGKPFTFTDDPEGGDISRESSNGFASYALKKMKDELKEGARADAR